jgi:hypothetical protein
VRLVVVHAVYHLYHALEVGWLAVEGILVVEAAIIYDKHCSAQSM